jgi:hypothetical protein
MSGYDSAMTLATHRGWAVFPIDHPSLPKCAGMGKKCREGLCEPEERGKHNVVSHTTGADANPKMIAMWWAGKTYNVGISMGKNGLIVIDEDKPDAFAKYAANHGVEIPPTFTVKTGKGRHYYFLDTQQGALGNHEGALKPYGINVRSGNAYVVGPGSKHFSGHVYTAENNLDPAPLPRWVIDAVEARAKTTNTDDSGITWETVNNAGRFQLPKVIKDGHRDTTLIQYAGSLLARELPREEAEILMEAAWERCQQPPEAKTTYTLAEALEKLERFDPGRSEGYEKKGPAEIFAEEVEKEARKIRVREAAQRKIRTEQSGPLPPFDAGSLRDMLVDRN